MKLFSFDFQFKYFCCEPASYFEGSDFKARLQAHVNEIESQCQDKKECVREVPLRDFLKILV